jgi:hypothetical protein
MQLQVAFVAVSAVIPSGKAHKEMAYHASGMPFDCSLCTYACTVIALIAFEASLFSVLFNRVEPIVQLFLKLFRS